MSNQIEFPGRDDAVYISLTDPTADIENLLEPDALVIKDETIHVAFSYPLAKPTTVELTATGGFTRRALALAISKTYRRIYDEEHAAVNDPGHIPGMLNRAPSDGPYGIWGHDLSDLVLHSVEKRADGVYRLGVDS